MQPLLAAACGIALGGLISAQTFEFTLDGSKEVPPVATPGTGTCTVTLNPISGDVQVLGTYTGLLADATAAHIHGPADTTGTAGVLIGLSVTGGTDGSVFGGGSLMPAQVNNLLAGLMYVNVHSSMFPDGEIRGQIVAEGKAEPYGGNPPNSLTLLGGLPLINTSMTFGVDNPAGSQPVGSLPVVAFASMADASYVASGTGTPVAGWGMTGAFGELLIAVGGPNPAVVVSGPAWGGVGNPAPVTVTIPDQLPLIGLTVYAQGMMVNLTGPPPTFGLTNGIELTIGL